MNEDTRNMILRLQREDLTVLSKLWDGSTEDCSEYNTTVRVYRRQLSLMDHYLSETRQIGTIENAANANNDSTVASSRQITHGNPPILTEFGDVHQVGGVYAHCDEPSSFTSTTSPPPAVNATTACSFVEDPEHLVVRLPSSIPSVLVTDVLDEHYQEKMEQLMAFVPGRDVSVLYKALQICHGRLDDALDYIFRQEENHTDMEVLELSSSTATSEIAIYDPALQSTERPTTTATVLERSVDHPTTFGDSPLKIQTSFVNKKESRSESTPSIQGTTIEDTPENFLQSSEPQSSPTLGARNAEPSNACRGIPPKYEMPEPTPKCDNTDQGFTETMSMTPDTNLDTMEPSIGHQNQQLNDRDDLHQLGGRSQQLQQALSTSSALDMHALNLMSPALEKQRLGEALYPKVREQLLKIAGLYPKVRAQYPELAAKLTGMLLELNNNRLLRLIADDSALLSNIDDALRVLEDFVAESRRVFV
ncbi:unnamed protein product [Aureobasidium mustum]|uniref:PABC domain-containing protein n=1 Tax=Aureobasidium mustum TaxID=2773714 RepID=A0A9N8KC00_9PEZI|nr:unnamed protein product [Aureobasidium mustum]